MDFSERVNDCTSDHCHCQKNTKKVDLWARVGLETEHITLKEKQSVRLHTECNNKTKQERNNTKQTIPAWLVRHPRMRTRRSKRWWATEAKATRGKALATGGRWSDEALHFIETLASGRARDTAPVLRCSAFLGWRRRWIRMLSISCSLAFASSLLSSRDDVWEGTDGASPDLAELFGQVR